MELYAKGMFFLGENEKQKSYDCCIHGNIVFKIGDDLLSDSEEWCVSVSAYRFLHTLFKNHCMGAEEFLIPHCGHFMIPSEDAMSVSIIGCNIGIDFDILHEDGYVVIRTEENTEYRVPYEEYKNAVVSFAEQIMEFYKSNPPREFEDAFDRDGYRAFVTEWRSLYEKAISTEDGVPRGHCTF